MLNRPKKPKEKRRPLRKVVRTEMTVSATISTLDCGHVLDSKGLQSDMRIRCQECPEEEFDG